VLNICLHILSIRFTAFGSQFHEAGELPFGEKKHVRHKQTTNTQQMSVGNVREVSWDREGDSDREKKETVAETEESLGTTYGELVQLSFNWRLLSMDVSTSVCQNPECFVSAFTAT